MRVRGFKQCVVGCSGFGQHGEYEQSIVPRERYISASIRWLLCEFETDEVGLLIPFLSPGNMRGAMKDSGKSAVELDATRARIVAYEYLCHLEEARK